MEAINYFMPGFLIKKKFLFLSFLLILFCAAGCSYKIEITPFELHAEKPIFIFSKPITASPIGKMRIVPLNNFKIVQKKNDRWDYDNPLWDFGLQPGATLEVEKLRYASLPAGYVETVKAKKLERGLTYMAIGFGPGSSGSVEFSLVP
ncbi:hypothetical protein ACO0LG_07940 [Undibacterium sp. Ji42W]|uniref:hypothetical protein n=1 Tax=Undibacterium sp. Ji42W TaxID=3413039 RepID=UPI003BEF857B